MNLESLANELLLDIFELLPAAHLLRAFRGLNSRFDTLMLVFLRASRHVDCRSTSKIQIDFICQYYIPSIANRIISFCLSDDDESPQQIDRFLSHGFNFDQLIHLRSLSFYHLHSEELMTKLMISWSHLPHLTHLKFSECYLRYKQNDVLRLVNSIWSLSKLTHCYLDIMFRWRPYSIAPTVISSSLESLYIQNIDWLTRLFEHTIRLRHLCAKINIISGTMPLLLTASSMISLKVKFCFLTASINTFRNYLQYMPNLRQLTVEAEDVYVDGHQWKEIITNHLPKLKVFRLKMEFYFRDRVNTKKYVDQLFDSFQTCFWIEERQWFIRCHYHPQSDSNYVCLYTLPFTFASFPRIEVSGCQSTCSAVDNQNCAYDHVYILNYPSTPIGRLALCQSRFVNIKHISLSLNLNDHFWIIVPRLDCLISLEVSLYGRNNNVQSQLQAILDRAPHLNSLKFGPWRTLEVPIGEINSVSVHQLDLRECDQWYNHQKCLTLISSSLGMQCKVLRINVENRMSIVDLVTVMANLRVLNVRCEDDQWNEKLSTSDDELLTWLRYRLPSTYTITRYTCCSFYILVWIR